MLTHIDHIVARSFDEVAVDVTEPEKRKLAFYHTQAGVGKAGENIREFWAISDEEAEDISKLVAQDISDILSDLSKQFSD